MKTTIIKQPALRLIAARSKRFPEGNREAMSSLESHLKTLKGRRFYGLLYGSGGEFQYYAGLIPESEIEEREFVERGFSIIEIAEGACARAKLLDWSSKIDQIGVIFGEMIAEHGIDRSRPQIEFYRSLKELHLLLPLPSPPEAG